MEEMKIGVIKDLTERLKKIKDVDVDADNANKLSAYNEMKTIFPKIKDEVIAQYAVIMDSLPMGLIVFISKSYNSK